MKESDDKELAKKLEKKDKVEKLEKEGISTGYLSEDKSEQLSKEFEQAETLSQEG